MELSQDQKKQLKELLLLENFRLYQALLREQLDIAIENMKNAKTWKEFVETSTVVRTLERIVIPLISNEIAED